MHNKDKKIIINSSGFRSVKNMPTVKELAKFYNEKYFQDIKVRPKNYQESYDKKEISHIKLLNDLCLYSILKVRPSWKKKTVSLLEVGVGEGFMIAHAKSKGWNVIGIDFSSFGVKKFNPKVLPKVKIGNAFEILKKMEKDKKKFHVCMIYNILEHIINPLELLENLRLLLKKDGIIVVTVPNDFSGIQLKAFELDHIKEKFWIQTPEHLHYFNTTNIHNLIDELNFEIIDMYSSFPIDFFLFHPGSNYIKNKKNGKLAHRARVELDIIMAKAGMENFHKLCQSFASCNVGRNLTIIITPK